MNVEKATQFILQKLENELPGNLTYHNFEHTKGVINAATRLGKEEHISEKEMKLLEVAASYHDCGWIYTTIEHEMKSCEIAREVLPGFGFTPEQINLVCKLIMATRLPWKPESELEKIIVDADLDYLGTNQFFDRAEALKKELESTGRLPGGTDWNKLQIDFLETHNYYTGAAIRSRQQKKNENLEKLKSLMIPDSFWA